MLQREQIVVRGTHIDVKTIKANNQIFIIKDNWIKTATLKDEWFYDVADPTKTIEALKRNSSAVDILSFWQRIPDTTPKYEYYYEWDTLAAIPIKDYEYWWKQQINSKTRNMVRKPAKRGVQIQEEFLNNRLITGITNIFNESPIRRGKPFWHFNKSFDDVKKDMASDAERSIFITAFYEDELIGFIKLLLTDRYAMVTLILDLMSHRDKSPLNGLIAKAVELCAEREIPYLTYTLWRRGSHGDFQKRNGFEKIAVPRYYVPINIKGRLYLKLGFHKGFRGAIPDKAMPVLLDVRKWWYSKHTTN